MLIEEADESGLGDTDLGCLENLVQMVHVDGLVEEDLQGWGLFGQEGLSRLLLSRSRAKM